jgi:hypothetical protein
MFVRFSYQFSSVIWLFEMPKENTKNLLARPDNEQSVVEVHKATWNRFADQEMQVGMAGPYTVETVR